MIIRNDVITRIAPDYTLTLYENIPNTCLTKKRAYFTKIFRALKSQNKAQ